jgi:hypothetical protein
MSIEIGLQAPMSEREETVELPLDHGRDDSLAREAEGWFHVHLVLEQRAASLSGQEPMHVAPPLHRSRNLLVRELSAFFEIPVPKVPPKGERPSPDLELHLGSVPNPSLLSDDAHVRPGRREPLQGTRPLVPPKDRLRRMVVDGPSISELHPPAS